MNQYQELYKKKQMSAEQALELIQDGDSMFSAQAAAEPQAILSKLQHLKETGVKGTTLNSCLPIQYYDAMKDPEMAGIMSHNGWFFTAGLRDAQKKKLVSAVPQSSTSVLRKSLQRLQAEGRRPVVLEYRKAKDKAAFRREHESQLILYEAAAKAIKDAGITRLPDLAALKAEYRELDKQKARLYEQYGEVKRELKEYGIIKQNVDSILRVTPGKEQAQEL